jgi:hypothetical protein
MGPTRRRPRQVRAPRGDADGRDPWSARGRWFMGRKREMNSASEL